MTSSASSTDPVAPFDVLVLVASAGGEAAVTRLLRALPPRFDVPILVMHHVPPGSAVVDVYRPKVPFRVEWLEPTTVLEPRTVRVCTPHTSVEVLPDGTFQIRDCERGALDYPFDRLLTSVAGSFGPRAIGVILSGMGSDGAAGARRLSQAGGRVLVQDPASAQYPAMPNAAIAAGAADLVVPIADLGQVIGEIVAGTPRPKARSELEAIARVFGDTGEIAALGREVDWAFTGLGPAIAWPVELRVVVRSAVESACPMAVWWGPELIQFYNEPWRRFLGASKHPEALGRTARETWPEIWRDIGPMVERVMKEGLSVGGEDFLIVIDRHGYPEEVYFTFSFSPVRDARGSVAAVQISAWETTPRVIAERRLATLRLLPARIAGARTPREACERAAAALAENLLDVPFAVLYLVDEQGQRALLGGVAGLQPGAAAAPYELPIGGAAATWPFPRILTERDSQQQSLLLDDLAQRIPSLDAALKSSHLPAPSGALLSPVRSSVNEPAVGLLVTGLNPRRPFDEGYRTFLELVAQQINAGIVEARANQLERERLERLAELDRAKTEFFANVSHEFRTPLTLLMTPLEELLQWEPVVAPALVRPIEVAVRNARRLRRLVDSLLDFSQLDARHQTAMLEPTDLTLLTGEIVGAFRSTIERAGLQLEVSGGRNLPLVPVDREMWEKVIANLLSNALKFTFAGTISVRLRALALHAEVVVADTGIGIPTQELPNLFKRFHRVRGARARSVEGAGIGLAIVRDLIVRMGGQLRVRSAEGEGTSFTIWMPLKPVRSMAEPSQKPTTAGARPRIASDLAAQAAAWVDEPPGALFRDGDDLAPPRGERLRLLAPGARVLVVDDNGDMRDYLRRLLGAYWTVDAVADGASALAVARQERPDLVLADVMMPDLDGFELLHLIRADHALKHTPLIFLTALAGEDTAVEGLLAGADDYLAKPFSARELIARVGGQIELSRTRRRAAELNAVLIRFSDAVRALQAPSAVAQAACSMLAERLAADVVRWLEVEAGEEHPRAADRASTTEAAVATGFEVPVLVEGVQRAKLVVGHGSERQWAHHEIALAEALASRCWSEVERSRAEAAVRISERQLARELADAKQLQAVSSLLFEQQSPDVIYEPIVQAAAALMRADAACYQRLDESGQLLLVACTGFHEQSVAFWRRTSDGGGSLSELALQQRARVIIPDLAQATVQLGTQDKEEYQRSQIAAVQSTPLISRDGRTLGAIFTGWRHPHAPSERDLALFDILARQAADVLERSRNQQALAQSAALQAAQKEAFEAAYGGATLESSLGILVRAVVAQSGADKAAIYRLDLDGTKLHHVVGMSPEYARQVDGFAVGPESLACGLATYRDEPVITPDVMYDARWEPWRWLANQHHYRGCWSFPMRTSAGQVLGTLALYFSEPREATPRDLQLGAALTQAAAIIICRDQGVRQPFRALGAN